VGVGGVNLRICCLALGQAVAGNVFYVKNRIIVLYNRMVAGSLPRLFEKRKDD
jgi:hypothetical protein